jgi:hypothetical protein
MPSWPRWRCFNRKVRRPRRASGCQSVYPQILSVQRRERGTAWADARLQAAELQSRTVKRPALAQTDLPQGRYSLVLAADPASFALQH